MSMQNQYKYSLPIGYKLQGGENDYVIEEVLGKGGFGITYKVKTKVLIKNISFELHFAVKEYFPSVCSREDDGATIKIPETMQDEVVNGLVDFINEGERLQRVCRLNPNIVNVNEMFQTNGTAYYVLEYLEGGDLRNMLKKNGGPLTEQQMLDVMMPIGRAVQCLHDNNILHLDIKPANIVMHRTDNNGVEPMLIDFGIAVHFRNDGTPTSKTPSMGFSSGYSPVEQYSTLKRFDPRLDVYSFCATCLYLLTNENPVEAFEMTPDMLRSMIPAQVSNNVASAIEHGMAMNKNDRTASINEVLSQFAASMEPLVAVPVSPVLPPPFSENDIDGLVGQKPLEDDSKHTISHKNKLSTLNKKKLYITIALVALLLMAGLVFCLKKCGNKTVEEVNIVSELNSHINKQADEPSNDESAKQSSETSDESSNTPPANPSVEPSDQPSNAVDKTESTSQRQWKHGLAICAQWIAVDLGFGIPESEIIQKTKTKDYTLDDLSAVYGSRATWLKYYDKLKKHEGETGDVNKLIKVLGNVYEHPIIKHHVKKEFEKYITTYDD